MQTAAQVLYPQAIPDRFDILGFDPRGVVRSDPATCFASSAEEQQVLAGLPASPAEALRGAGLPGREHKAGPPLRRHVTDPVPPHLDRQRGA
ncbi:MAG: hypothetical protein ACR2LI_11165 [Propionibacteriaceae bacterium]